MTRNPRADELLREALAALPITEVFVAADGENGIRPNPTAARIRAYLAVPQSEPEYVYRTGRLLALADEADYVRGMSRSYGDGTIMRAEIGPWEAVE